MGLDEVGGGCGTSCNMCCTILHAVPWEYNSLSHPSGHTRKYNVSKQRPCYYAHNPHEHIFSYTVRINYPVEEHTECQVDIDHQDDEAQCAAVSCTCSVGAAESHSDPFYPINADGRRLSLLSVF
jgi:hypothetical protein